MLIALALAAASPSLPGRLAPIDQCSAELPFREFRDKLASVVRRRDASGLLDLVDEDVLVSLGMDGQGKQTFIENWQLNNPRDSGLWSELGALLRLGCVKGEGESYVLPSFFEQASDADALETYLAVIPGSPLRTEPRQQAAAIAALDWHLLTLERVTDDGQWFLVRLADGRKGYVHRGEARNLIDYRMVVSRIDGRLRIRALVAGD